MASEERNLCCFGGRSINREQVQQVSSQAIDELIQALEQGKSDTLLEYLAMLSKFHQYSFGNCLLIALQRPDASYVAGFHRWKELGRFVKKGEKGIAIIAPMARKRHVEDDESRTVRSMTGFRVVHVFDVSQTEGEPLPEFATSQGDPGDSLPRLEALIAQAGVTLLYEPLPGGANGVSEGGVIRVRPDLSPSETFRVLVHELAHEKLHQSPRRKEPTQAIRETEAEAVAFVVSRAFGIDSTTRSSDYVQLWGGDKELLLQSLDHIQRVAADIITSLSETREEVTEVTLEHVGLVLGLEMSRLARSSKDWHHLLVLRALFGTLLADQDGIYDPTDSNDRVLLGLKGTMSEFELFTMRNRLERGRPHKAERGELFFTAPMGYMLLPSGQIVTLESDPRGETLHFVAHNAPFEVPTREEHLISRRHLLLPAIPCRPRRLKKFTARPISNSSAAAPALDAARI